jgi:hypothetical protein
MNGDTAAYTRLFWWLWLHGRLITMKIRIHAAFSTIRQIPRKSLPGAPIKSSHQPSEVWNGGKEVDLTVSKAAV